MVPWLRCALLLAAWPGARSQLQLAESGGAVTKEGESLRLTCTGSGGSFASYDMFWYRQRPGTAPEFVSRIYTSGGGIKYATWAQGRFTISRDNARSEMSLAMSNLRRADSGRYLCAARDAPCGEPGVLAQVQLAASGPGAGRVSGPVTLSCAVSGVSITERYNYWYWVRQRPGAGLESLGWIHPYNGGTSYAPAFRGRVTISADTAGNRVSLQLRSLSVGDAATYYCARRLTVTPGQAGLGQELSLFP